MLRGPIERSDVKIGKSLDENDAAESSIVSRTTQ